MTLASPSSPTDSERQPLLPPAADGPPVSDARIAQIVMVMVLAVFVYNADGSLVLATHPVIASDFDALESSSWLFTAFGLAGAATQAMFGKLSDIYGQKPVILFCYAVFALGCIIIGCAQSMTGVILGRVICGSVGAGMGLLVSILLAHLVPLRDVAAWRSYINLAATGGRSLGGPLGGWLADVVGWRWSFLGQAPLFMLAFALCSVYLPDDVRLSRAASAPAAPTASTSWSLAAKLASLDLPGGLLLGAAVLAVLLPLQLGGTQLAWTSAWMPVLFGAAAVLLALFVWCEARWTRSPIIPLELFANREAAASILIMGLQTSAQLSLMFSIPIYFQVTDKATSGEAGAHLFPAVLGNTLGAVLSGISISRTGRYKWLAYTAMASSSTCYLLLILTWHGHVSWLKSLFVMPGGFGSGVAQSAVFVSLQNVVDQNHIAPALSTLYLSSTIGPIAGVAASSAAMKMGIKMRLSQNLADLGYNATERAAIVASAVSNVAYVYNATGRVSDAISDAYVFGLEYSHGLSLVLAVSGFVLVSLLRDHRV